MKTKTTFKILPIVLLLLANKLISAVPVAGFTLNSSTFCTGTTYTIIDQSTNAPTAWSYTIDDGFAPFTQPTITTVQNPTVVFSIPSTYTITLIAYNSSGASTPIVKVINILPGPFATISPTNASTCAGGAPTTISLTGAGGGGSPATYQWSNGGTSTAIVVSPSITTTYSCLVTESNGCSAAYTSTVTISTPTLNITSVPANICPGVTSTLTVLGTGPAPRTYTWSNNSNSTIITSSVAGIFTATMTNAQGCKATKTYSLGTSTTLSLTTTATPTTLCAGNTGIIRVTGGATYTWSTGATVANTTVNPTSNAIYTVTGKIGTCTGTAAISVSVNTIPTIAVVSSPTAFCNGESATITATGASNFTINPGATFASSAVVSPNANTTYSVRGQNPGCAARTETTSLIVHPNPVLAIASSSVVVCAGEALALSITGANTYTWSDGSLVSTFITYPLAATAYSVIGLSIHNCSATAVANLTVDACTGITKASAENLIFSVYPNPSNGNLTITSTIDLDLLVIDIMGRTVETIKLNSDNQQTHRVEGLNTGIYFIKSANSDKIKAKKLVVN